MIQAFKIAIICFVFVKLTEPGMIFSFYAKLIEPLPTWIRNPLGWCEYCITGQVALWYFLVTHFKDYNFIEHLFFTSFSIFLISIFDRLWNSE